MKCFMLLLLIVAIVYATTENSYRKRKRKFKKELDVECFICYRTIIIGMTAPCGHGCCGPCMGNIDMCPICRVMLPVFKVNEYALTIRPPQEPVSTQEEKDLLQEIFPLACASGYLKYVKLWVEVFGADVNKVGFRGHFPLHLSPTRQIARYLIKKGANVDQRGQSDSIPIGAAAKRGHLGAVKVYVNNGADVNLKNDTGSTALDLAALNGHIEIVRYLVRYGAFVNMYDDDGMSPLWGAVQEGHYKIVKFLIRNYADVSRPDYDNISPLYVASQNGNFRMVKLLVENGADINFPNKYNITPLYISCESGHKKIVEYLLKNGADMHQESRSDGLTPLGTAILQNQMEIAKILIAHGANVREEVKVVINSEFFWSCDQEEILAYVQLLIENGGDINAANHKDVTLLWMSSYNGISKVVEYLLEKGANFDKPDSDGTTPLGAAVGQNQIEIEKIFIKYGAIFHKIDLSIKCEADDIDI